MRDTAFQRDCERAAKHLLWNAVWPSVVVMAVLPALPGTSVPYTGIALAVGLLVIGLSALLLFDALLFRLMGSHRDEASGGAAVDELLARMRLKPRPASTRGLRDRIGGSRTYVAWQRGAFAAFVILAFAAFWQPAWQIGPAQP